MNQSEQDKIILKNIKQKSNNKRGARQAKMKLEDYIERKRFLLNQSNTSCTSTGIIRTSYNIDNGTGELEGVFAKEPMSPEEVESWFKVDTKKWRLSHYWNKQQPNGLYLVSANITRVKFSDNVVNHIEDIISNFDFKYKPSPDKHINECYSDPVCAVFSLQDIHIGKQTIDGINSIEQDVKKSVELLVRRAYNAHYLDQIVWILGGDLINMDTYSGTTTSGTILENSMNAYDAYKAAFELQFWCINLLKSYCNNLHVVLIPGNHDRLSSGHIAYALSRIIVDPNITWDIDLKERKVFEYGINMIGMEHGDFNTNRSFFAFATEYPDIWGRTKNRIVYTGHLHKKKKTEYITEDEVSGFQIKIIPALCRTDNYHYKNKWTGNQRSALIDVHSKEKGFISQLNETFYT